MTAPVPTPTGNARLPHRPGGFATLAEALDYAAGGETGLNFHTGFGELGAVLGYAGLRGRALAAAGALAALGLGRGARVALVAETSPDFLALFYGCQYAGLLPCPLPALSYAPGRAAYVDQLAGMLCGAQAGLVFAPTALLGGVGEAAARCGARAMAYEQLRAEAPPPPAEARWRADEPAYVQFSSGSTAQPRGVLISQRALAANVAAILQGGLRLAPGDRAFSWLPLYHDMGLVGFSIAALGGQCSVDYLSPAAFARRPALWLRLMSQRRSTITYAPGFGYRLAAQRAAPEPELDLRALRVAGVGGDMVRAEALAAFAQALAPAGLRADALRPSYGMAETALAVSMADAAPRIDTVRLEPRGEGVFARPVDAGAVRARRFVACGRPLPGWDLRIVDAEGHVLPERAVGRIVLRGPGLFSGYLGARAAPPVLDAQGFFDTGDLGYRLDGQLVPTGRGKDLIILRGRNLWPQDIEWAAEKVAPLREGDVAAFAVDAGDVHDAGEGESADAEALVLAVQCRSRGTDERAALRERVAAAVREAAGVTPTIVLVPPGGLPFTSSGKLSRRAARQRYLGGAWRGAATPSFEEESSQ